DLGPAGESGEPLPELADRDGDRAGDVPGGVFGGGADIEHGDLARPGPAQQLVAGDFFDVIAQVGAAGGVDLGQQRGGHLPHGRITAGAVVAGQGVEHAGGLGGGGPA